MRLLKKLSRLLKSRIELKFIYPQKGKKVKKKRKHYVYKCEELPKKIKWSEEMLMYFNRKMTKGQAARLPLKERALRYRAQQVISARKNKLRKK